MKFSAPLTDRLMTKGFSPVEIPDLTNDLINSLGRCENQTQPNQSGMRGPWTGVNLPDESLFLKILSEWMGADELHKQIENKEAQ